MKIKISNLSFVHHKMDFEGTAKQSNLGEPFVDLFKVDVEIDKSSHQIVLKVEISLTTCQECDRCGIEYSSPLKCDYKMIYLYGKPSGENDDTNVEYITPETDTIDISRDIYDFAHLAIPVKNLCNEDCKGLCPRCGVDLNTEKCSCLEDDINPFSPFADLKKRLNSN